VKKRLKNQRLDIKAEEYNDFLEIRRDYKQGRLTNQPGRFDTGNNNQTSGIIRSIEGLRAGSAIGFEPDPAKVVNDRDKLNPVIEFTMVTAEQMDAQTTGILLGPAQKMGFAQAHTPGRVAFARVNFTDTGHTHATIANGQTDLVSGTEGDLILAATGDNGNQLGAITGLANAIVYIVGNAVEGQPQNPMEPEDPANNNDCCEYGQLFVCPLPAGIDYEVLCSAIDPPIDGEKMYKVRFFAVDTSGVEILPVGGSSSETLEHRELLTLPCTSEVCRTVDLSSVTINGVVLGEVTYGNQEGCCDRKLFVSWEIPDSQDPVSGTPTVIQQGSSLTFTHAITAEDLGVPVEVSIDAELIDIPERIPDDSSPINFTLRSTLIADLPFVINQQVISGDVDPGSLMGQGTVLIDANASSVSDYSGRASVGFRFRPGSFVMLAFTVRWSYR